jgi:hypothetical protein
VVADARDVLGGNGILLENHVAAHRAFAYGVFLGGASGGSTTSREEVG